VWKNCVLWSVKIVTGRIMCILNISAVTNILILSFCFRALMLLLMVQTRSKLLWSCDNLH